MSGNINSIRTGVQQKSQQIPAIQPQNGAAVRMKVANRFQTERKALSRFQIGQQDQVVDFSRLSSPFVNGADFARNDEARGFLCPECAAKEDARKR